MRKKEILKRFGITGVTDLTNFNQNKPASSIHTTSSDSGLGSIPITRQNVNLTNRPPLPIPPTTLKDQDTSQDSTLELQSDETPLPKRLSTDSTDLSNNSRQFGLEYFDSQNSDIRDPSIEKLIGWVDPNSAKTTPMTSKIVKKTESTTDSLLSTSMSSTSSSVSDEAEVDSFALSRKMIQEQLELIRSQKEELLKSQQNLIGKPIKPPVKSYKSVECNPHELSTIKEEANNTPMSERVTRKVPITAESTSSSLESVSMLNDSTQFKSMNLASDAKYLAKTNSNKVNLSLFDPGSSLENSFFNLSNNLNANSNNNNNSSKSRNSIDDSNNRVYKEYASGVYDYSSSVSEKLSQHTINEDSSSGGSLMSLEKRIRNKKWANILMSADEDDNTTTATNSENSGSENTRLLQCQNLSGSSVSHGPLASDDSIFDNSSAASSYIGFAKINNNNNKKTAQRKVAAPVVNNESVNNENNSNVMVMMRELSLSESLIKNSNNNESLEKSLKPFSVSPNSSGNPIIIKETIKTLNKSNESVRSEKDLKLMQESSCNNGSSGIFADFIGKKENLEAFSKTSLMDEPEISFVSIKSCSQSGASPLKDAASTPAAILFTRNQMARLSNSASPINANFTNCNFTKLSNTNSESFSSSLSGLKEQKLLSDKANFVCLSPNMAESILNSTQIENLLNEDKNNLTMVDYHDATNVFRMSDSLISFERHEKSAVSSPFSADSFKKPSPPPMKIQNVNKWNDLTNVDENVSQWKVEKSESNGSASQSMGFSYLSQVPLNSTPIVTTNTSSSRGSSGLKSIYENSTNLESTRINTNCYEQSLTKLSPLVNQDSVSFVVFLYGFLGVLLNILGFEFFKREIFVENHKKNRIRNLGNCDLVKRNKGGMGFSIDRNGNFCDLKSFKIVEKNRRTCEAKLRCKRNYEDNNCRDFLKEIFALWVFYFMFEIVFKYFFN